MFGVFHALYISDLNLNMDQIAEEQEDISTENHTLSGDLPKYEQGPQENGFLITQSIEDLTEGTVDLLLIELQKLEF